MSETVKLVPLPSPHHFRCPNFIDADGLKGTVVVVIVPVTFKSISVFDWNISYACNFYRSCHNVRCAYAKAENAR